MFSLSLLATVRGVISLSKGQRNEAKKTLSERGLISVHSVQFLYMGTPKARCSPEPRVCEPLLLANPYTHTLRPQRSRASTIANRPARHHALLVLYCLVGCLLVPRRHFCGYGLTYSAASFLGGLATWFGMRTNSEDRCPRIARGVPWVGSVTGGEACGYPCSEKEGFTHPSLWRAPCFWGAKNVKAAR